MFRQWQTRTLKAIAWISLASAIVGMFIGFLRASEETIFTDVSIGMLTGILIGFCCSFSEFFVFSNSRLRMARQMPLWQLMLLRTVVWCGCILAGMSLPIWLFGLPWQDLDTYLIENFVISAAIALAFSSGIELSRLLGPEATSALITGRYARPRLENRVVLFADLIGSTALAERLGELQFHAFLSDVAQDFADPIYKTHGDVHRYVGDAVIVTWPLEKGVKNGASLHCALGMHRILDRRASFYKKKYDTEPRIRVAIHCGQVAAGEIGDWKKEIALLGDTMNTTARIESAARDLGERIVLSDDLVKSLPDTIGTSIRALPAYEAAGKQDKLTLWAVDQHG
ncbi:adenylate/guanylate cyclase domain-containing protein [Roseibium alexandrii]|uniref:Adenylate cyclase 1 n=1 Tax=Roseibium alexandrii TaxID=388408 RepID=A0A0M7A6U2_9HYPH|nr:adenylate/guanylate cyclase domain-containing protein [Roseibium alexandrii]CTQ70182.1 Adenylate cyclase 1 [Roseibium alexandrii]